MKVKTLLLVGLIAGGLTGSVMALPPVHQGPVYNPGTGHNYYLLDQSTWTDAETVAVQLGGHLATINDAQENQWVWNTFNYIIPTADESGLWIGLNDRTQEGHYVWSSGEAVTYFNWSSGQPDNLNNEDYGIMWKKPGMESQWNDTVNNNYIDRYIYCTAYGVIEVIPEPCTLILLVLGGGALLRKRRA